MGMLCDLIGFKLEREDFLECYLPPLIYPGGSREL